MLLDYDRVFSAMGVPACLWRRTGEIYKGNREFTELVGVDGYMMRDVSAGFLSTFLSVPWCFSILLFIQGKQLYARCLNDQMSAQARFERQRQ